ncbi:MAG: glycosyltransferase family 2 protein [Flavobacteriales bacterium]|nr:glycosyltransferase family 2 protein [Flavobacteriales bacterium]
MSLQETAPFFSVIIPTYNRAHSILESVNSVLSQDFGNFELLVIDDGSTDETQNILRPILEKDNRFRYVYQNNTERSAARNHGIKLALGTYICFLDSDDIYLPDHLSQFHKTITANEFPVAMFVARSITDHNGVLTLNEPFIPVTKDPLEVIIKAPFGAVVIAIHWSILAKYKFDESLRIGEDQELWFRITAEYPLVWSEHFTLVIRDFGDRTIDSSKTKTYIDNLRLTRQIIQNDSNGRIRPAWKRFVLSAAYFRLAQSYLVQGRTAKFYYYLLKSIVITPKKYFREKMAMLLNTRNLFGQN